MNNTNNLLPIGSVVLLKQGTKKIMITGFYTVSESDTNNMYDYCGCLYPEGLISSEQNLLFNHEQIDKIYYMGYIDDEEKEFKQKLMNAIQQLKKGE